MGSVKWTAEDDKKFSEFHVRKQSNPYTLEEFRRLRRKLTPEMRKVYYYHVHRLGREPRWRGIRIIKYPQDLIMYAEAIFQNKPDFIVETGTRFGGSAAFFADIMLLANPGGTVITIDTTMKKVKDRHPGVTYIEGSSVDPKVVEKVRHMTHYGKKPVMLSLDSNHAQEHVYSELLSYRDICTKGQYIVVEDCYTLRDEEYGPNLAVRKFLSQTEDYILEPLEDKYIFCVTRGGWLKKAV